ncbi:MAG: Efflux ABC transporter, permease protein [uncultured Nocardioidaceae bacterium]|uniref:Efflux ABC transporter, permease protein n=1 Tax=uncultured Nocardioidaceae bacterium TaxID=253824 RepID=A0A6J4LXV7_9ACTN|nr:MAG: Efflux ABC transporter, permease protein [uncultured Nocardioidaceae bacterium]
MTAMGRLNGAQGTGEATGAGRAEHPVRPDGPAPLSFAPSPGGRPFGRMVVTHARMEVRLLFRNGEQLLLALVIPLLLLVGGAASGDVIDLGGGRRIDVLAPGVLALAVMSTAFTSVAISTAFERRYGVLKRLGASPLPRAGLLLGKVVSLLVVVALQMAAISVVALLLSWEPIGGVGAAAGSAALVALGTASFAGLGLLMAGTLPAEATLAGANLVYVVLLVAGAVVVPLSSYPSGMRDVVTMLPSGALAEGLRNVLTGGGPGISNMAVLAAWAAVAAALTARTFRWE